MNAKTSQFIPENTKPYYYNTHSNIIRTNFKIFIRAKILRPTFKYYHPKHHIRQLPEYTLHYDR